MKLTYEEYLTRYPQAYAQFIQHMNRTENLYQHMLKLGVLNNVKSFISIGSGYGDLEIKIAQQHAARFSIVEPTTLFFDKFVEKVNRFNLQSQLVEMVHDSFDHFVTRNHYDLAISIHSWYAFGTQQQYFDKFKTLVNQQGHLFINLVSENSPVAELTALSQAEGINLTAEKLAHWLTSEKILYRFEIEHNLRPVSLYISNNQLTTIGRDFAAFLLACPWEKMSKEIQDQALLILQKHNINGEIDICSGSLLLQAIR